MKLNSLEELLGTVSENTKRERLLDVFGWVKTTPLGYLMGLCQAIVARVQLTVV